MSCTCLSWSCSFSATNVPALSLQSPHSDDIKMLSTSSLVNLDRSSSSLNREGLQYLVRQLTDIVEVRTIDLSSNHLADDCAQELAELVMLDRKGAENPKEQVRMDE